MARVSWEATETDLEIARHGCILQAESRGIDVTDPKIASFIDNQAKVIATCHAESRWLRNILNQMTVQNEKVAPKS